MNNNLFKLAVVFVSLCNNSIYKISFIRKMPKGYWGVFSHKGKLLGKYKTKQEAKKRLSQIEFFKHKNASTKLANENITYTELLRKLNKEFSSDIVKEFRKIFKDAFDQAIIEGKSNPEEIALQKSLEFVMVLDD